MKKLTFSKKLFTRYPDMDFSDDGTHFRIYLYKDELPISVARACGLRFVDIRLDYTDEGLRYEDYKEDIKILDMFNGCEEVDMDKLIENCEYIYNKYLH